MYILCNISKSNAKECFFLVNFPNVVKEGGKEAFVFASVSFLIKDHIHFSRALVWAGLGSPRDCTGESAEVEVSGANFFVISRTTTLQCE